MPRFCQCFNGLCEQNLQDTLQLKQRYLDAKNKRAPKSKDKKQQDSIQSSVHVVSYLQIQQCMNPVKISSGVVCVTLGLINTVVYIIQWLDVWMKNNLLSGYLNNLIWINNLTKGVLNTKHSRLVSALRRARQTADGMYAGINKCVQFQRFEM